MAMGVRDDTEAMTTKCRNVRGRKHEDSGREKGGIGEREREKMET
jgi:hypothetical protein